MNKNLVKSTIICVVTGIGIGAIIKAKECNEAYIRGINKAWELKLNEAYEHIADLYKKIEIQNQCYKKSVELNERLLKICREKPEES